MFVWKHSKNHCSTFCNHYHMLTYIQFDSPFDRQLNYDYDHFLQKICTASGLKHYQIGSCVCRFWLWFHTLSMYYLWFLSETLQYFIKYNVRSRPHRAKILLKPKPRGIGDPNLWCMWITYTWLAADSPLMIWSPGSILAANHSAAL